MNIKSLCYVYLAALSLSQAIHADTSKCYDSYVLNHFYSLTCPVEGTTGMFTVPGSINSDKAQVRLFGEPLPWERDNLWVQSMRKERYEEALMEIVCLSNYGPAQIKEIQRVFLDRAPAPIRDSELYDILTLWFSSPLTGHSTLSELQSLGVDSSKISFVLSTLEDLNNLYIQGATPQQVDIFQGTSFAVYQSPQVWAKIEDWIGPLAEAASIINAAQGLSTDVRDIVTTTFLVSLMANDAALERLQLIHNNIQSSSLWNDPAFQNAYYAVKDFLETSKTSQVIQELFDNILDHLPELTSNSLTLAGVSVGKIAIQKIISASAVKLSFRAAGMWSIGLIALDMEFQLILGIVRQLENCELSVACSTIAYNLCLCTQYSCELRVMAMYAYWVCAGYVIEAFDWEPLPFWKFGDDTVELWTESQSYFRSLLDYEYNYQCDAFPPNVEMISPTAGDTISGIVNIVASAYDDIDVQEVKYYASENGSTWTQIGIDIEGADGWSVSFDTTSFSYDDTYWLSAEAVDTSGNTSPRDNISITIDNQVPAPQLYVDPVSITFDGILVGQVAQAAYVVQNTGTSQMSWQANTSQSWISNISPSSWAFSAGESRVVTVTVNTNGFLADNTYNGTIKNISNGGDQNVSIVLKTTSPGSGSGSTTLNPTEDAHIYQLYPDTNYNQTRMRIGKSSGWDYAGLLKFDMSSLMGKNAVIESAYLALYCDGVYDPDNDSQEFRVYRSTKNWNQSTVTYNSNGIYYNVNVHSDDFMCDSTGWIRDIDVKSHVSSWIGGSDNYGFMIRLPSPSNGTKYCDFNSSENSNPPELHIQYVLKDGILPTLSITQPYAGQIFYTPDIAVSGTAYDASGLMDIEVRVNNGVWADASGLESWSLPITLMEGGNLIEVKATDDTYEKRTLSQYVYYYPPDYMLGCYPPNIIVKQGTNGSASAYLTSLNTFNSSIMLSVSGLPSGSEATFMNNPITPTDSANIIFDADVSTATGTYPIIVTASGGGVSNKSQTINLVVQDGMTPDISILNPTAEATYITPTRNLTISGTASDTGSGMLAATINTGQVNTGTPENWSFDVSLTDGWNSFAVTAVDALGNQAQDVISIKYMPPLPEVVTGPNPEAGAMGVPVNPTLQWNTASYATSYDIYIGPTLTEVQDANSLTVGIYQGNVTQNTFIPGVMAGETQHFWRVDSVNISGTTAGNVWGFTTSIPVLVGDVNGDFKIDIFDLVVVTGSYARNVGDGQNPSWNYLGDASEPDMADVNNDGTVDIFDLVVISSHFGEEYP